MASLRAARALKPLSLALLVSQAAIVVTGGAVRLTGSGLGCPTWPECTPGSYFPVENQVEGTFHSWIEFGNRLLTFVLVIFALATLIAVLRSGRKDLRILAAGQFLGIFSQGVLGGITVLTDLNPLTVASHDDSNKSSNNNDDNDSDSAIDRVAGLRTSRFLIVKEVYNVFMFLFNSF